MNDEPIFPSKDLKDLKDFKDLKGSPPVRRSVIDRRKPNRGNMVNTPATASQRKI
jgi:hypothetical protein